MPANLTPQYQKAEEEFRRAQTGQERLECLELMLKLIPKHKGTEKLQADLKTKLKEAREEVHAEKSSAKTTRSYRIPRQGAGTVILLGAPNSGKSRLLQELTHAHPEVAPYPFTTREPLPGMMPWEDVTVQLIDTPPVTSSHLDPYMTGFVRSADLVLLCFDGSSDDAPQETADVIEQMSNRKTRLSETTGFDEDDMSIVNVRTLLVVTRGRDPDAALRVDLFRELSGRSLETVFVDFEQSEDVAGLRDAIYRALDVIRVYTKRPGKPADHDSPFSLPRGGTVEDLAAKVHRDLVESVKHARVWGASGIDGQTVGRDHVLADGDMVELHG
jgi:ribosome-interacting GTPase 1